MTRLTAIPVEDLFFYTLSRDDAEQFVTRHPSELTERLLGIGITDATELIAAAQRRGTIEIRHETDRTDLQDEDARVISRRSDAAASP